MGEGEGAEQRGREEERGDIRYAGVEVVVIREENALLINYRVVRRVPPS